MNTDDGLWQELQTLAQRSGPRYDASTCGRCPSCRLGPTAMMFLSGIAWALCGHCNLRWPITTDQFDVPDDDDETYRFFLGILAEADAAPDDLQHKGFSMKSKATENVDAPGVAINPLPILRGFELKTRSIARFELFALASALGWPAIALNCSGVYPAVIAAGETAWRESPLGHASARRLAYLALIDLHQQRTAEGTHR